MIVAQLLLELFKNKIRPVSKKLPGISWLLTNAGMFYIIFISNIFSDKLWAMKKYLVDVDIKRGKIKPKYKYIQIEIVVYTFKLYLFKRNTKANKKHWLNIFLRETLDRQVWLITCCFTKIVYVIGVKIVQFF